MKNNTRHPELEKCHPELDSGSNIPKLRFPEFVDSGEWEKKELGKLGKFLGGGTPNKSIDEYWHGTIPWISSSDLNEDDLKTISITRFINEKSVLESATKIVPKGSVLFVSRVGTGKLAINSIDLCTSQDFTNFIPAQIYNYFLGYYFLANKSALTSLDQGTSIKGFSKSDLEKFKLIYPKDKQEQQKIADCLSSVDSLILAQSQKVELLKEHKKGLMQQLFPQDTEEVPKLRFPEFKNAHKWEEKKLGDICDITNGKANAQDHIEDGIYPLFDRSAVVKQTNNYLFDCEAVIIPGEGMRFIPKYYKGKFDLHQRAYALQNFKANGKFIYYSMDLLKEILATKAVQSTVLSLRLPILENFIIKLPSAEDEQQKIANCLSSLDEQISQQTTKLQTLKEHKKALMQQLFPSSEVNQ